MSIQDFKKYVDAAGILNNTFECQHAILAKRELIFGVAGELVITGVIAKILVGFSGAFPNCVPVYFLLNQQDFIRLPHVDDDGYICYTHTDTLVLDINNAPGIIAASFALAVKTLEDGICRKNDFEFYKEYEAHWQRLKDMQVLFANLSLSEDVATIKYSKLKDRDVLFAVSDETDRINSYSRFIDAKENPPQFYNGLYIPLKLDSDILIPKNDQLLSLQDVQDLILKNITPANKLRIDKALSKAKQEDLIIIDLPLHNGNHALFAIRFKKIDYRSHPLITPGIVGSMIPYHVKRIDPEFMLARGGNGNRFMERKVLVIGGGSIGSAIAEELIKAAVINVDVLDKDSLETDNAYRHNCGFMYLNRKKPEAIKEKLSSYYPHSNVKAFNMSVESAISKKKIDFTNYDGIIVATGNATINQFLMNYFYKEFPGKPLLFAWLDPYGIGGHCLITNITGHGCYQCLYTNEKLHNSASFAADNQVKSFVKNISGCGSIYVPYGALDALQTAILCVRKMLDVFTGKENINAIYSWKGSSDLFLREGYVISNRYLQNEDQLLSGKSLFYQPKCTVCGKA